MAHVGPLGLVGLAGWLLWVGGSWSMAPVSSATQGGEHELIEENEMGNVDTDRAPLRVRVYPTNQRRRRLVIPAVLVAIIGLLLGDALAVSAQAEEASGDSVMPLDGGSIAVLDEGPRDAPALVLIHGLGGSVRWWDQLVPVLVGSYRVIRVDLLGHGQSAKPAGNGYGMPEQARRVGAVLDRLAVRRVLLVGHSTGGSVATALAEQRSDLVTAIMLINTGPRPEAFISNGFAGQLMFTPVVGQLLWRVRTDGLLRQGLRTGFNAGYEIPQELVDDLRGTTYHAFNATSRGVDDYLRQRGLPDRLMAVNKPLLVIFGEDDQRWRSSSAMEYHTVPGAGVELLSGVGHSPMLEDPLRTERLLKAFTNSMVGEQ